MIKIITEKQKEKTNARKNHDASFFDFCFTFTQRKRRRIKKRVKAKK